jgi:hypothetical protein
MRLDHVHMSANADDGYTTEPPTTHPACLFWSRAAGPDRADPSLQSPSLGRNAGPGDSRCPSPARMSRELRLRRLRTALLRPLPLLLQPPWQLRPVERAHEPTEGSRGDRPVLLRAEDLVVDRLLVVALLLPKQTPEQPPATVGKGRCRRQQLAAEQARVAVGAEAAGEHAIAQRLRRPTHSGRNWQNPKLLHRMLIRCEFCQCWPKCE